MDVQVQNEKIDQLPARTVQDLLREWENPKISVETHWKTIEAIAKTDGQYAINCAFLLLNQFPPTHLNHSTLKTKIQELQKADETQMDIESLEQ